MHNTADDVEHARKKVQRTIITQFGHGSVETWNVAVKVFTISRKIMTLASGSRRFPIVDSAVEDSEGDDDIKGTYLEASPQIEPQVSEVDNLSKDVEQLTMQRSNPSPTRPSYAQTLATPSTTPEPVVKAIADRVRPTAVLPRVEQSAALPEEEYPVSYTHLTLPTIYSV